MKRNDIIKAREEIKQGLWKNERKEMDVGCMIDRLETQYHAMNRTLEKEPNNDYLRGAVDQIRESLHLLLNWTGN